MADAPDNPTYGSYLRLDRILAAQEPRSEHPDELLFIIIHQASELWMKLVLAEIEQARVAIGADRLRPAFKQFARVARIQDQLIQSWDVLGTLTPADYHAFRPYLGTSSGFQSHQYRLLEFAMGNKDAGKIAVHRDDPAVAAALQAALERPSLYDETLRLLAGRGFAIPSAAIERDFAQPYVASAEVEAQWRIIYSDTEAHWDLYELAEKLVDLETRMQMWRFAHLKAVERIIGHKAGTGGTSGIGYLSQVLGGSFFPELMSVRTLI